MRLIVLCAALMMLVLQACKKDNVQPGIPGLPTQPAGALKDIVYSGLPSPYYHFEYNNAGLISKTSFASEQSVYQVSYTGTAISEVKRINVVNGTRYVYTYDNGKPVIIKYINAQGEIFLRNFLSYSPEGRLINMDWEMKVDNVGYIIMKEMGFTYYADGNLKDLVVDLHAIDGLQEQATYTDHFQDYDNKKNTDDFVLFQDFNQRLLLIPEIKLQHNNPGKVIRTGTGTTLAYEINYTYSYNNNQFPLTRNGTVKINNGPDTGKVFLVNAEYSYY